MSRPGQKVPGVNVIAKICALACSTLLYFAVKGRADVNYCDVKCIGTVTSDEKTRVTVVISAGHKPKHVLASSMAALAPSLPLTPTDPYILCCRSARDLRARKHSRPSHGAVLRRCRDASMSRCRRRCVFIARSGLVEVAVAFCVRRRVDILQNSLDLRRCPGGAGAGEFVSFGLIYRLGFSSVTFWKWDALVER
jgi:hypothetical protein